MSDFVVVYFETEGPARESLAKTTASDLAIDRDFVRMVNRRVSGHRSTSGPTVWLKVAEV